MKITSAQNDRVKAVVRLRKRSVREEEGLLITEGVRPVERALQAGYRFDRVFLCEERLGAETAAKFLSAFRAEGIEVLECADSAFRKMAYRSDPEGVLGIGPALGIPLERLELPPDPLLLVAERVEKPGNLGALLRIADAAGAHAVIVCDPATDVNNPNAVRAAAGALFSVPTALAENSERAIDALRGRGVRIAAALPDAEAEYTRAELSGPLAIAVGAERDGLSPIWRDRADVRVRIPMRGLCDSLNVSVSAAILLYETLRQRGG